jgi:hypothetical protein
MHKAKLQKQRKSSTILSAAVDRRIEAAVVCELLRAEDRIAEQVVDRLTRKYPHFAPKYVLSHKFFEPLGGP